MKRETDTGLGPNELIDQSIITGRPYQTIYELSAVTKMTTNESQTTERFCPIQPKIVEVHYLFVAIIGPIVFVGLILNTITLSVLKKQKSKLNSLFLLQVLAVSDSLFLLACFVYFFFRHMYGRVLYGDGVLRRREREIVPLLYYYSLGPYFITLQNRNWLIVIITAERFGNIVAPFWARVAVTRRSLVWVVSVNALLALGLQGFNFFDRYAVPSTYPCAEQGELVFLKKKWGEQMDYYLYVLAVALFPLILLSIMNIVLIVALRRASRNRAQMTGEEQKEAQAQRQATVMVIAMVIIYAVCEIPSAVDRFAGLLGYRMNPKHPLAHYGRKLGLLLIVVDSTVNFLAYCASNRRFRRTLMEMFGSKSCRRAMAEPSSISGSQREKPTTMTKTTET